MPKSPLVYDRVLEERAQAHATRKHLFAELEKAFDRPVVTFFTSFHYPVMIVDDDGDMLEGVLRNLDLSKGLALCISSPGGDGLAAERIVNMCRAYSGTGEYWAIVRKIKTFLTPERTKTHGRPIYRDEAAGCDLNVEMTDPDAPHWACVYELYIRTNNLVQTSVSKCIESAEHSYATAAPYEA